MLPSTNNPIRRFLLSGGRIVAVGDVPFYYHASGARASSDGWADAGAIIILGRPAASASNRGLKDIPTAIFDGVVWRISNRLPSERPADIGVPDVVLTA